MTARNRRTALGLLAALLVLLADQASKAWVVYGLDLPTLERVDLIPTLSLTFVRNRGVTFGLLTDTGAWSQVVLAVVALAVTAALFIWLRRSHNGLMATALGAIGGGAVGNVADRLRYGWVVDFIHFHVGTWSWYVFNVADAAIVCGVAVLVLDGLRPRPDPGHDAGESRLDAASIRR